MKLIFKKTILLILIFIVTIFPIISNATYRSQMDTLITSQDNSWKDNSTASSKVTKVMNSIIAIVRIVGMCVAVTLLLVVAMKYMSAAPGEKADIKKASIAYVVGALVLFGAVGLLGIINDFASGNIKRA